ncbi:acetyl-CoA acetyltransferase [Candidatus Entotheonella palauensis]|uniref:acetyl-CoA acetyltransferase n=1 Tax=Candidatus Entotheonella palauensis TaxID=93172 RepID=UPI000B7E02CD|nr:acetyl-CoA acetyltransferase [Candidatus Entotheonella palauensis]
MSTDPLYRKVAIVGVAESDIGRVPYKSKFQLSAEASRLALEEAGFTPADVDGLLTTIITAGGDFSTLVMAEYMGMTPRYTDSTSIGGSSFVAYVEHAAMAIATGRCDVALICHGSTNLSDRGGRSGPVSTSNEVFGPAQFEEPYGISTIGSYAMAAQRHMYEYGTTSEQLAEIAVATRKWASMNPRAMMREPLSIDDVLNSRMIASPLHLFDCCLVTDAGGAVVLTSMERARDLQKQPIAVLGTGEAHTHRMISQMPDLTETAAKISGKLAFERAGVQPGDIDVAEIYDSFTITVLLTLESLGFCAKGEGGTFVSGQRTAPGGDFPMNTQGGALSYTHPGMFGIFTIIEAVRQLRGECGPRQVDNAELALCNGTGGVLSSTGTIILGGA